MEKPKSGIKNLKKEQQAYYMETVQRMKETLKENNAKMQTIENKHFSAIV